MDLVTAACEISGPIINAEKTVVMNQLPPDAADSASKINFNGTQMQALDNFNYLDDTLSRSINIDDEVAHQISKASQAFGRLQNTVWNRYRLHLNTILKMNKAVMMATLLCGAETRTAHSEDLLEAPANQLGQQERPVLRSTDLEESGSEIYKANRVSAAKFKREACKSQLPPLATPTLNHPNLPTMSTDVPGTNQSYWTSSDPVYQQPDNVYFFFHSLPCRELRTDRHPVIDVHTVTAQPSSSTDIIRSAPTAASTVATTTTTTTTTSRTPPH
ncbi:hypothetical protein SprV_0200812700 [Sparganum proliferum]